MLIYAIRRLNLFIITLLTLSLISFNIVLLNPKSNYADYSFTYGWLHYLKNLIQGNWGLSNKGLSVLENIAHVLPATLELCFLALITVIMIGIPLGTIAGVRRGRAMDTVISSIALLVFSTPIFWLAIMFIMFFSLYLGLLPVSGQYNLLYKIPSQTGFVFIDVLMSEHPNKYDALTDAFLHYLMPTLVLAMGPMAELIKLVRDSVASVIKQNFVKVAFTKGLSKNEIIKRHVLKNAIPPIIPKFGIHISTMMTFAIVTEYIFNWPGIGTWLLDALADKDYNAVQAGVMTIGFIVLTANITADLLGSAINPLTRKEWYAFR